MPMSDVQETCTRNLHQIFDAKFLVQVNLYKFLVQVSCTCVTGISAKVMQIVIKISLRNERLRSLSPDGRINTESLRGGRRLQTVHAVNEWRDHL